MDLGDDAERLALAQIDRLDEDPEQAIGEAGLGQAPSVADAPDAGLDRRRRLRAGASMTANDPRPRRWPSRRRARASHG
jgi:hypothetical protein